ncbi:MAG: hypothetical protein E6H51_05765 [Betaproteobacteria bacterium]|nr:MAG: hypothetical protein E6H51_05765 [Betaproteobacteria bacterium]
MQEKEIRALSLQLDDEVLFQQEQEIAGIVGDLGALARTAQNKTSGLPAAPDVVVEVKPDVFLQFSHRRVVRGQHGPECGVRAIDAHAPAKDRETQRMPGCLNALELHGLPAEEGRAKPHPLLAERYLPCELEFPLRTTRC